MATVETIYLGELRTEATHVQSGSKILTDAPTDNHGKGGTLDFRITRAPDDKDSATLLFSCHEPALSDHGRSSAVSGRTIRIGPPEDSATRVLRLASLSCS